MIRYKLFSILVISISLLGCSVPNNQYLSITFTHTTNQEDQFTMDNYAYDFQNKEIKKIASFDYNAQYPLTYYDRENNKVYYTKRTSDSHSDEIYVYNCDAKESVKISNGIFAVNSIFKISKEKLLAVAVGDELDNLFFYEIDLTHNTVKRMKMDGIDIKDFNVIANYYNNEDNSLYFAGYSYANEYKLRDDYNNELIDDYEVTYFIYKYSFGKKQLTKVIEKPGLGINSLVAGNGKIYFYCRGIYAKEVGTYAYDLKSKKTQVIKELEDIYQLVSYDDTQDEILYIANEYRGSSALYKMNSKTHTKEQVFHESVEGQINNAFLGF